MRMPPRPAAVAWTAWTVTAAVCVLNAALFHGRVQNPPPTDGPSQLGELLFLVMPLVFVLVAAWLVINTLVNRPVESVAGLALIALGMPLYLYYRRTRG